MNIVAKIIIALNLIVVLASAGLFYYSTNMIKPKPINDGEQLDKMINDLAKAGSVTPVKLKRITLNLYSRSTRLRFLDIELNILPFQESKKEFIKENEAIIADSVIQIAGNMEPRDLNSVSGKILLENRVRTDLNEKFKSPIIKEIYFSKFTIQ